jgi:hypothetical protein
MRTAVEIAMFNAQREKAIRDAEQRRVNRREQMAAEGKKRDQIEKCYRVYDPPQIHELSHQYAR